MLIILFPQWSGIDGNFVATAAMAKMLVQSQRQTQDRGFEVHLLNKE